MYVKRKRKNRHKIIPASWKVEFAQWEEIIKAIKHYTIQNQFVILQMGDNKLAKSCVLKGGKKNRKKGFVSENCKARTAMNIVIITNLQ